MIASGRAFGCAEADTLCFQPASVSDRHDIGAGWYFLARIQWQKPWSLVLKDDPILQKNKLLKAHEVGDGRDLVDNEHHQMCARLGRLNRLHKQADQAECPVRVTSAGGFRVSESPDVCCCSNNDQNLAALRLVEMGQ